MVLPDQLASVSVQVASLDHKEHLVMMELLDQQALQDLLDLKDPPDLKDHLEKDQLV